MNKLQKNYALAKAAYDTAIETETWELVEGLELPYIEAEGTMVEWALEHAEQSGMIPAKLLETLKEKWMFPQYKTRMVDLAFKLEI
ncbi:hypothetical protein [Paenibacillus graminis]|uniref:hypothetical protein n=1 Tax=Paenibacillus graminis TaxID=189425 RepID=UPI002DB92BB5|nr:hypothetical protein [Paenibacillus graminis]MEC0168629.1 hypothetical protein [Paenibacillus graminis]